MKSINLKLILTVFLFITSYYSHSQYFIAGHAFSSYVDIYPDTLMNYYCSPYSNENYYLDVNGDSQNDFRINANCNDGAMDHHRMIYIASLNPYSYVRLGRYDSVFNSYDSLWWITKVARPLQYDDTINSITSEWDSIYLYLTDRSTLTGAIKFVADWININDEYIGIKYQSNTDTLYGWIRVNCNSYDSCYIKDYSIGALNQSVQDIKLDNIIIYPDPVKDYLTIKTSSKSVVEITNIMGQVIMTINNDNNYFVINLVNITNGIYIIRVKGDKGVVTKKIIKE